jgi:hypothetical protein
MTVKRYVCRREDPGNRVGNGAPSLKLVQMGQDESDPVTAATSLDTPSCSV